jgi:UDP-glucuronate 4-epimerase
MIIIISGVAGFIASRTAEFLLRQGHHVVGVDNLNDYYDIKLKKYRLNMLSQHSNFNFFDVDIENKNGIKNIFKKNNFDTVLNLAARAGVIPSIENPYVYFETNTLGTLNLLECMREYKVDKMVLASTSSLYAGQKLPFNESLEVNTPISPYAASKKAAEVLAYTYHYLYGMDISIVRYFNVFGIAGRPDMSYFRFINSIDRGKPIYINGDGTQSRDFTYLDDIAEGTISAIQKVGYEIFNLGGGNKPISINQMIIILENILQKKTNKVYKNFNKADMKSTWADIKKAKKILNWSPKVSVEDGLKIAVNWYLENKELVKTLKF